MIQIAAEQLAERDKWERMLKLGQINLDDCLSMCMGLGVPMSDYIRQRYESAVDAYKDGKFEDLAEPFGIAMSKREKNAQTKATRISNVRFHVDAEHAKGLPKIDPSQYEATAFHAAGTLLDLSPSYVFEIYYREK